MAGNQSAAINTPYNDVFHTLLIDCSELIIPLINETFGEHYTGEEKVLFSQNEHYLSRQDGGSDKRITDSSFTIAGKKEQKYLYECQSTADNSMLVRIFEYATQIALEQGEFKGNELTVQIPRCAVLFLRSTKNTPDKMKITVKTPGGNVSFHVNVMKVRSYTLNEIFEKNLLFLIPFYIFSHENRFAEYNEDEGRLNMLKNEYVKIMDQLDQLAEEHRISAFTQRTIIELSSKVLENIAKKHTNVKEGVKSVMGGRVLEYEAKTIKNEGKLEDKKEIANNLYQMGMEEDFIAQAIKVSVDVVRQWLGLVTA